jgi:hypothetical protein
MYTLFRNSSLRALLSIQAPPLLISFVIASIFFTKFGSFALECAAFLALWFVLDAAFTAVRSAWLKRVGSAPTARR